MSCGATGRARCASLATPASSSVRKRRRSEDHIAKQRLLKQETTAVLPTVGVGGQPATDADALCRSRTPTCCW